MGRGLITHSCEKMLITKTIIKISTREAAVPSSTVTIASNTWSDRSVRQRMTPKLQMKLFKPLKVNVKIGNEV